MLDPSSQDAIPDILQSYLLATNLDPTWYKAWHAWALANSEVVAHYAKVNPDARVSDFRENILIDHLVPSVHGELSAAANRIAKGHS